jgi:hypothetical protein
LKCIVISWPNGQIPFFLPSGWVVALLVYKMTVIACFCFFFFSLLLIIITTPILALHSSRDR